MGVFSVLLVLGGVAAVFGAQQRALRVEEAYVASQLENAKCLDSWGTNEGAVTKRASVTGPAPLGARVSVRVPYTYRVDSDGGPVFADTSSEAVYAVSISGTRRVSGDEIAPC